MSRVLYSSRISDRGFLQKLWQVFCLGLGFRVKGMMCSDPKTTESVILEHELNTTSLCPLVYLIRTLGPLNSDIGPLNKLPTPSWRSLL